MVMRPFGRIWAGPGPPEGGGANHLFMTVERELAFDIFAVRFNGFHADVKQSSNLPGFQALSNEPEHTKLAGGQARGFRLEPGVGGFRKHLTPKPFRRDSLGFEQKP